MHFRDLRELSSAEIVLLLNARRRARAMAAIELSRGIGLALGGDDAAASRNRRRIEQDLSA